MNGLSLANLSVADAGPLELIDAAAAAGFGAVNVWLSEPPSMALFTLRRRSEGRAIGDPAKLAEIAARSRATGVAVFSASAGWVTPAFDPAEIAAVVESAASIGTRTLAVVGWDRERGRLIDHLGAICAAAAGAGMLVGLEQMTYSAVPVLAEANALLDAVNAPNLRLIVDALHVVRSGAGPAEVAALDPARVHAFQICDGPAAAPPPERLRHESVNDRLHPGQGEFPLNELLAAIPKDAVIEVEVPARAEAHAGIVARARSCYDHTRRFLESQPSWQSLQTTR